MKQVRKPTLSFFSSRGRFAVVRYHCHRAGAPGPVLVRDNDHRRTFAGCAQRGPARYAGFAAPVLTEHNLHRRA